MSHILEEMDFLAKYCASVGIDRLMADDVLSRACLKSLEIIGETINPRKRCNRPNLSNQAESSARLAIAMTAKLESTSATNPHDIAGLGQNPVAETGMTMPPARRRLAL